MIDVSFEGNNQTQGGKLSIRYDDIYHFALCQRKHQPRRTQEQTLFVCHKVNRKWLRPEVCDMAYVVDSRRKGQQNADRKTAAENAKETAQQRNCAAAVIVLKWYALCWTAYCMSRCCGRRTCPAWQIWCFGTPLSFIATAMHQQRRKKHINKLAIHRVCNQCYVRIALFHFIFSLFNVLCSQEYKNHNNQIETVPLPLFRSFGRVPGPEAGQRDRKHRIRHSVWVAAEKTVVVWKWNMQINMKSDNKHRGRRQNEVLTRQSHFMYSRVCMRSMQTMNAAMMQFMGSTIFVAACYGSQIRLYETNVFVVIVCQIENERAKKWEREKEREEETSKMCISSPSSSGTTWIHGKADFSADFFVSFD